MRSAVLEDALDEAGNLMQDGLFLLAIKKYKKMLPLCSSGRHGDRHLLQCMLTICYLGIGNNEEASYYLKLARKSSPRCAQVKWMTVWLSFFRVQRNPSPARISRCREQASQLLKDLRGGELDHMTRSDSQGIALEIKRILKSLDLLD